MRSCDSCIRGPEPKVNVSSACNVCDDDRNLFLPLYYTDEEDQIEEETHNDPIVEAVRKKMLLRSKAGLQKYGVTLGRTDLSTKQWLIHAQEEAMDLANYLEVLIRNE